MSSPGFSPISDRQTRVLLLSRQHDGRLSAKHRIIDVIKNDDSPLKFWSSGYKYEALSYCWGIITPTHSIDLNGVEVGIHKNLDSALRALTEVKVNITIWTDALCIDQRNETEKLAQIQLMFEIYMNASHVWAWLGHPRDPSALDRVKASLNLLYKAGKEYADVNNVTCNRLPDTGDPFWTELHSIYFNPYFDRLWILQEACAARHLTFVIGHVHMSFESMTKLMEAWSGISAIRAFQYDTINNDSLFKFADTLHRSWKERTKEKLTKSAFKDIKYKNIRDNALRRLSAVILMTLLMQSRSQKCSDPKDRIFALLGMVQRQLGTTIQFPWTPNATTETIFLEAFYYMAPYTGLTYMLSLASIYGVDGIELPSWCPNFAVIADEFGTMYGLNDTYFRNPEDEDGNWRSSLLKPVIIRGADPKILDIEGTCVGSIVFAITCEWPIDPVRMDRQIWVTTAEAAISWIRDAWTKLLDFMRDREPENSLMDNDLYVLFWSTLFGNQVALKKCIGKETIEMEDYQQIEQALLDQSSIRPSTDDVSTQPENSSIDAKEILRILNRTLWDKSFVISEQRLMGLGPFFSRTGDDIWIFKGAERPFSTYGPFDGEAAMLGIARLYKLRGEVYMPRIMNGEVETDPDAFGARTGRVELI